MPLRWTNRNPKSLLVKGMSVLSVYDIIYSKAGESISPGHSISQKRNSMST